MHSLRTRKRGEARSHQHYFGNAVRPSYSKGKLKVTMLASRTAAAHGLRHAFNESCKVISLNTRFKHSKTQVKRLFKKNPANIRVSTRENSLPKYSQPEASQFQEFFSPTVLPNGWSAPPTDPETLAKRDALPFTINRTGNKPNGAVGFLPVYSRVR